MRTIDSLLNILVQQGGTELRLASDRRPQMFKEDAELPLTIPAMSTERIRELLDDLWTAHEAALRHRHELSLTYDSEDLGRFALRLAHADDSSIEVRFLRQKDALASNDASCGEAAGPRPAAPASLAESEALPAPLADLLKQALSRGASDLHLSPHRAPIIRANGALEIMAELPGFDATGLIGSEERRQRLRAGGSVDRAFDVAGVGRVRVNVYSSEEGLCAAVRILRSEVPTLAELNLPPQIEALVDLPNGLVIACGPTGCGKSSTMAALVQHALHLRPQVVVTLEDPIEYHLQPVHSSSLVRQREVGTHVRDFTTGLRDTLREDPDIILVGEMRDPETISLALTAAETGHLVFASLHSRTAASAVERIVDTYPPERQRQIRVQLADALRAVISQRLLPTVDGSGRVPAVELLRVTHAVANLIREGRTAQIASALQSGGSEGMVALERSLTDLVRAKRIRRETALAAGNDFATLTEYLRGAGN